MGVSNRLTLSVHSSMSLSHITGFVSSDGQTSSCFQCWKPGGRTCVQVRVWPAPDWEPDKLNEWDGNRMSECVLGEYLFYHVCSCDKEELFLLSQRKRNKKKKRFQLSCKTHGMYFQCEARTWFHFVRIHIFSASQINTKLLVSCWLYHKMFGTVSLKNFYG